MFGGFCLLSCFFGRVLVVFPFGGGAMVCGCQVGVSVVGVLVLQVLFGEFDPGSGRTLAACLTHASRTERPFGVLEWRTGE